MAQNKLRFDLKLLPNPWPEDPTMRVQAWGQIVIRIVLPHREVTLLDWEWNLDALAEWFGENQAKLCQESLPFKEKGWAPRPDESLRQALRRFRDREDSEFADEAELDDWYDRLYLYENGRTLGHALGGARVPPIYIGCNHGAGEISLSTTEDENEDGIWWDLNYNGEWAYPFDMEDFCHHLRGELRRFLRDWATSSTDPDVHLRANDLMRQLGEHITGCCT